MKDIIYELLIMDTKVIKSKSGRYGVKLILRTEIGNNMIFFSHYLWVGNFQEFQEDSILCKIFDDFMKKLSINIYGLDEKKITRIIDW